MALFAKLLHSLVSRPGVYNSVQKVFGAEQTLRKLKLLAADTSGQTVLDVGAGTGNGLRAVPADAVYIWLDTDPRKLAGVRAGKRRWLALLASATAIPLEAKSVDTALCLAMSHHLDDGEVVRLFAELARVCRRQLIFVDPVWYPGARMSALLWKYDQGSHPRSAAVLRDLVQQQFEVVHEEEYAIHHQYWLCTARPRA